MKILSAFNLWLFGWTHDLIYDGDQPYLERWFVSFGKRSLRLHKFWKGDQDRHLHDHPWNFWTFPLSNYYEYRDFIQAPECFIGDRYRAGCMRERHLVSRFKWHYRPANYRHIVMDPPQGKPVYTIVLTGDKVNEWGFWKDGQLIPHREYFG